MGLLAARGAVRGRAGVVRTNRNPRRLLVLSCLLESVTGASQAMLVHHNNGGKDAPSSSQEPEHQVDPQSLVQLHCGGPLATCQPRVGGFKSGLLLSVRGPQACTSNGQLCPRMPEDAISPENQQLVLRHSNDMGQILVMWTLQSNEASSFNQTHGVIRRHTRFVPFGLKDFGP